MKTYIITEQQNANNSRQGVEIQAKNLTDANRAASRAQMFYGTTLVIQAQNGPAMDMNKPKGRGRGRPPFGAEPRSAQACIRITPTEKQALRALCAREGLTEREVLLRGMKQCKR